MKKNRRNGIKHILAAVFFCMVLSIGMVSLADVQGTVIAKSAVIRASADPQSEKLGSVSAGKTIDIISKTAGTDGNDWYQVYVDANTKGYIRSDLIKVPDGANIITTQAGSASSAQSADSSETTATPVEAQKVTVKNTANIRKGASTSYDAVATANRGMVLTVIGEADGSDGKWYQVSFTYHNDEVTGFIRSDLVTTDNVPADSVSSEIEGEENPGEEQLPETAPETEQPPEQPENEGNSGNNDSIVPINVDVEPPYVMAGFEPYTFRLPSGEEEYNGYINGNFLICYAQKANGEEGWFLIDQEMKVCQRYVYTADGVEVPRGSVGLIPVIVLIVIIIVLVAVVGLLLLRLRGQGSSYKRYKGYDGDDDRDDDDIEDLEDMDDDEPQPIRQPQRSQPVRRPQAPPQGQPVRRPQGQQPPRHPQGQQPPVRRPQGSPSSGNAPQGQQPVRRPQAGTPANSGARPQGQQPPRRPQGQQPPRRPQPQNDRVQNEKGQPQKGYKAKNLLEDDDMDIMDIE